MPRTLASPLEGLTRTAIRWTSRWRQVLRPDHRRPTSVSPHRRSDDGKTAKLRAARVALRRRPTTARRVPGSWRKARHAAHVHASARAAQFQTAGYWQQLLAGRAEFTGNSYEAFTGQQLRSMLSCSRAHRRPAACLRGCAARLVLLKGRAQPYETRPAAFHHRPRPRQPPTPTTLPTFQQVRQLTRSLRPGAHRG